MRDAPGPFNCPQLRRKTDTANDYRCERYLTSFQFQKT